MNFIEFEAPITGLIKSGKRHTILHGTLKGKADRKTGKFRGVFNVIQGKRKQRFYLVGVISLSALIALSFAIAEQEEQGIEFSFRLAGNPYDNPRKHI